MRLFRAEEREQFQKMVDALLLTCRRWGVQPKTLRADHNLMIDTFGSQGDTTFAGLPVQAIPLEYGRDYVLLVVPLQGVPVGMLPDGTIERIA